MNARRFSGRSKYSKRVPSKPTARWKRVAGLAALMGGAGIGALVVHFGKEEGAGDEHSDESSIQYERKPEGIV